MVYFTYMGSTDQKWENGKLYKLNYTEILHGTFQSRPTSGSYEEIRDRIIFLNVNTVWNILYKCI